MSRFLRFPELEKRLGLSRHTVDRLEKQGAFPKRKYLSASCVGWLEDEINRYMEHLSTHPASDAQRTCEPSIGWIAEKLKK